MNMLHNRKKKVTAVILCMLLGMFGAHRFYLGYKQKGVAQLMAPVIMLATTIVALILTGLFGGRAVSIINPILMGAASIYYFIVSIWVFVDFLRILFNTLLPADGQDYIHMEGPVTQSTEDLPDTFAAADSGVVMIDQLFTLYKKGAITAKQYTDKLNEFRSRM